MFNPTNDQDHGGRENEPAIRTDSDEPYRASNCSLDHLRQAMALHTAWDAVGKSGELQSLSPSSRLKMFGLGMDVLPAMPPASHGQFQSEFSKILANHLADTVVILKQLLATLEMATNDVLERACNPQPDGHSVKHPETLSQQIPRTDQTPS